MGAGRAAALLLFAVSVALFGVSGCAPTPAGTPDASSTDGPPVTATAIAPSAATSAPGGPVAVPDSLKFTATTIDGKAFDGAALAGKPVILWFWAAWCPKCRAKAPDVAAVQRDFAGKAHVVGVAGLGSGEAAMDKFAADTGIGGFPHLADDAGVLWKKFAVTTQEYFVVIAADGQIVHKGPLSGAELRQRTAALAG